MLSKIFPWAFFAIFISSSMKCLITHFAHFLIGLFGFYCWVLSPLCEPERSPLVCDLQTCSPVSSLALHPLHRVFVEQKFLIAMWFKLSFRDSALGVQSVETVWLHLYRWDAQCSWGSDKDESFLPVPVQLTQLHCWKGSFSAALHCHKLSVYT